MFEEELEMLQLEDPIWQSGEYSNRQEAEIFTCDETSEKSLGTLELENSRV